MDIKDKNILITGVSGSIGTTLSKAFSEKGAHILGVDRNLDKLRSLKAQGYISDYIMGDLTKEEVQENVITNFAQKTDVLINNLGGGFSKTLQDTSIDDYRFLMTLNFEVAVSLCKGVIPYMITKKKGKVINVSTVLADNPLPTLSAYVASKAALIAFTKSIALQFAPYNIRINVVAPGYINSDKHQDYFETRTGKNFIERFMPTGVLGKVEDLVGVFLLLSSEAANSITGQVIKIDGGYSIW